MKAETASGKYKNLAWAVRESGLSKLKLAKLARSGVIPGAFNLASTPRGWRFREAQFIAWLDEVSERGLGAFEVAP